MLNLLQSVMKSASKKANYKNQRLKTLCTLDTTDIVLKNEVKQIIHKKKTDLSNSKLRRKSIGRKKSKSQVSQTLPHKQKTIPNNNDVWQSIALKTRTLNSQKKQKIITRKGARQRIKTQHKQQSHKRIVLNNLQVFKTVKNIKFQMDEQYNIDPYYLINTIKATNEETVSLVKIIDKQKKRPCFYIMKKSNNQKIIAKYQKQIEIKEQLTDKLKIYEKRNFSCIYKVYKKDKFDNFYVIYFMEGQSLSWKNSLHKKLIHNLSKNNMQIMKHLIVQISKAIFILSTHGYYHSQIKLRNILLELEQDQQNVKVSKIVKLGNLHKCLKVKDKKQLLKMPLSIHTPPQILNFIMFENQSKNFNREWLNYIYKYDQAWRINVWSLGILTLQLLNQEPLRNSFLDIQEILQYQNHIFSKCSYLIDKISDKSLEKIVKRMLSINPLSRPNPQEIVVSLTS